MLEDIVAKRVQKQVANSRTGSDCKIWKDFADEFPASATLPSILWASAQCHRRFGNLTESLDTLEIIINRYSDSKAIGPVLLEAKEIALLLGLPQRAATYLTKYGRRFIPEGLATAVWTQAATLFAKEQRFEQAFDALKQGEKLATTPQKRIELLVPLARLFQSNNRGGEAEETLNKIRATAPLLKGEDVLDCMAWTDLQLAQAEGRLRPKLC
jgi:tetratricopeptide (TPR) repeat protein